jgi:hypothetical protein
MMAHCCRKLREPDVATSSAGANIDSSFGQSLRRAWKQQPPPQTVDRMTRGLLCRQRTPACTSSSRSCSSDLNVSLRAAALHATA